MIEKILFAGLLAMSVLAGVQSYRLQDEKANHDLLKLAVKASEREAQQTAAVNLRNKERTNEEYARAIARARAVGVRVAASRIKPAAPAVAISGNEPAPCYDRELLVLEIAGWFERDAERLNQLLAAVSQRIGERFSPIAREVEEVAAAGRSCVGWGWDLGGSPASETPPVR